MYRERLNVPLWLWLAAPAAAGLLAAEVFMGAPGYATILPYTVLVPAVVFGLWWAGRIRIAVTPDELQVDDARLPLRFVGAVAPLSPLQTRDLLGPVASPKRSSSSGPGWARRCASTSPTRPTRRPTG